MKVLSVRHYEAARALLGSDVFIEILRHIVDELAQEARDNMEGFVRTADLHRAALHAGRLEVLEEIEPRLRSLAERYKVSTAT